jgi:isopentenyl-diphosphate delta-isomerase
MQKKLISLLLIMSMSVSRTAAFSQRHLASAFASQSSRQQQQNFFGRSKSTSEQCFSLAFKDRQQHKYSTSTSISNASSNNNDYGSGMDQQAMMESDMLIAVDSNDVLVPNADLSKRDGHSFTSATPRAALHRAFSFFLFDANAKMLLTRRASDKITFPGVWTNTVCSHPLYSMKPEEVDVVPAAYPSFPGIKHAAIRKCKHELGIENKYLAHDQICFLTRFHYWAADTLTYGKDTPWGEHEVDYILFLQVQDEVPVIPNPEEVSDYKYVSLDELKAMMEEPGLLWSPWFRGIMDRGGWDWWADLEGSLAGKYTNEQVTFFDPPKEHVASYNSPSHGRETGVLSMQRSSVDC